MSEANYSIDRDLAEAKAMAEGLLPYVYEDNLYGTVGGMFSSGRMPSLTIGALLLRLQRLHALEDQMTPEQKARLTEIEARNDQVRREWSIHYNEKMLYEANSRLSVIESFFADCDDDPRSCAANYLPEALRRTIVQAILNALNEYHLPSGDLDRGLRRVDAQLRRFTETSSFLWSPSLEAAYPRETYWWLYAKPPRASQA